MDLVLGDEAIDGVGIDTHEVALLQLLLEQGDGRHVEFAVAEQDAVALGLGGLDVGVLLLLVDGVEIDEVAVLVGLVVLDERAILVEGEIFALGVLHQRKVLGAVVEGVALGEHAVVDEELEVVPLLLILLAVLLEDAAQAVGDLLGDIGRDLLDVGVALEVAAADVERDVGRVDDAVEQRQELGDDALDVVGDEDLVAVELDLVALELDVGLDAREVEDAGEREGVIDVEVDPEQGIVVHGEERVVELLVVLVLERRRRLRPEGLDAVDDVVLVGIDLLAVLPLRLLAEDHGHGHKLAVLREQLLDGRFLEIVLAVVVDVEDDVGTAVGLLHPVDGVFGAAVAGPAHGVAALAPALGDDLDLLAHHEGGVESETEMADDGLGLVLVLVEEVGDAGEGNLVDVLVDLLGRHADAAVGDGERAGLLIEGDADGEVAQVAGEVACRGEGLHLLRGVHGVADHLAKEYLVVGIQKLLDDGEDVLRRYSNITFLFHYCDMSF